MKKLAAFAAAALLAGLAHAAPVASGGPLAISGNGVVGTWVDSGSVHTLGDAVTAWSDLSFPRSSATTPSINFSDFGGSHFGPSSPQPFFDDNFVVRFQGYLNVSVGGTYLFRSFTDDGFQLVIGGETISSQTIDRSPDDTIDSVFLSAGLYSLDFLVWEQGGAFMAELDWMTPGSTTFALVPQEVLFTSIPGRVPEPSVLSLLGLALLAVGLRGRRKI